MTKVLYQSMFVFLSIALMAVLFVMQPTDDKDMQAFKSEVQDMFVTAAHQVMGDQSVVEPFAFVWTVTQDFYGQSADQALALLKPDDSLVELALMFDGEYLLDKEMIQAPVITRAASEEPVQLVALQHNETEDLLDPNFDEDLAYVEDFGGRVAGESITTGEPQPTQTAEWVELHDSITGEAYCVAVFFGAINSYMGPCAREEEPNLIYAN
jgi:hypothetical protein